MEHLLRVGDQRLRIAAPENFSESGDRISFWWGLTTASINLTRWILQGDDLTGKTAIELGCGLGLSGIGAMIKGAEVTFSDYVPDALGCAAHNVNINELDATKANFLNLDWEDPAKLGSFDLILGSEIVYDYFFHSSLIRLMEQALAPGGHILLADRKRLVVQRFIGRLISRGFTSEEHLSKFHTGGFPKQEITIFDISR